MKKIYYAPAMETVEIKAACLLAGSLPLNSKTTIGNSNDVLAPGLSDEGDDYDF